MPGLIRDATDLKVLLLFIMRKLEFTATIETVTEITANIPGTDITYFDVAAGLASLVDTEHLTLEYGEYGITEKGIRNGEIMESDVPYSVRNHAERRTLAVRAKKSREQLVKTSRTIMRRRGYKVEMSLSDGEDEVMSLHVIAVSEEQAEQIEQAFRERAEGLFGVIMRELLE